MNIPPSSALSGYRTASISLTSQPQRDSGQSGKTGLIQKPPEKGDVLNVLLIARDERKEELEAIARKKIETLKARLQMLERVFSSSPEKLAMAAGQLMKELASLAQASDSPPVISSHAATEASSDLKISPMDQAELAAGYDASGAPTLSYIRGAQALGAEQGQFTGSDEEGKLSAIKAACGEDAVFDMSKEVRELMRRLQTLAEKGQEDVASAEAVSPPLGIPDVVEPDVIPEAGKNLSVRI